MEKKRFQFLGIDFHITNLNSTIHFLKHYNYSKPDYIVLPDTFVASLAKKDPELRTILNSALLTLPDGKPTEFFARLSGVSNLKTVSGFWLCRELLNTDLRHYFVGSTIEKLDKIRKRITDTGNGNKIVGMHSLPFLTIEEFKKGYVNELLIQDINEKRPDLIWIGLSSPKQDYFMHANKSFLEYGLMLGIGGVFDYLSGDVDKSPEWIKKIGLRWLWRWAHEPKRLSGKYLTIFKTVLFFSVNKYLLNRNAD